MSHKLVKADSISLDAYLFLGKFYKNRIQKSSYGKWDSALIYSNLLISKVVLLFCRIPLLIVSREKLNIFSLTDRSEQSLPS